MNQIATAVRFAGCALLICAPLLAQAQSPGCMDPEACNYNQWASTDDALLETYGLLYNFDAVTDPRGLCPWGWHIGTDSDWMASEAHLGMQESEVVAVGSCGEGENIASLFKSNSVLWSFAGGGNNLSGFTALPAGRVDQSNNNHSEGGSAWFWAPSGTSDGLAIRAIYGANDGVFRDFSNANQGLSVRCVKD